MIKDSNCWVEETERRLISKLLESMGPEEVSKKLDFPIEKIMRIEKGNS